MFNSNGFVPCHLCGTLCQPQYSEENSYDIICSNISCRSTGIAFHVLNLPEKPTFKRLYATMYNGKPVGIYESNRARLLVKYENPSVDSPDNLMDSAFSHNNGSNGEIEVLSEYIRKLILKTERYDY